MEQNIQWLILSKWFKFDTFKIGKIAGLVMAVDTKVGNNIPPLDGS